MHSMWNCSQVNATEHLWWKVNIGLGNGWSQCWLISVLPYSITRAQRVNFTLWGGHEGHKMCKDFNALDVIPPQHYGEWQNSAAFMLFCFQNAGPSSRWLSTIAGLMQDCSALTIKFLQSCTKPLICISFSSCRPAPQLFGCWGMWQ